MPEPLSEMKFNSIEELITSAESVLPVLHKKNSPEHLVKSLKKCHAEGEKAETIGDLEMAFLYYYRCFSIWVRIRKLDEFKKHDFYYNTQVKGLIPPLMERLEYLKTVLKRRYEEADERLAPSKIGQVCEIRGHANNVEPAAPSASLNGAEPAFNYEERGCISCTELYRLLSTRKKGENTTLIIDVRSSSDFAKSRMNFEDVIHIPVSELPDGLVASNILSKYLAEDFKPFFKRRKEYDWVIIVDWYSRDDPHDTKTPIGKMMSALVKWDPHESYKRKPVTLEGGFEDWLACHPRSTTNPKASPPRLPANDSSFIDDITFPSERDLEATFPFDLSDNVNQQPAFDRSKKPTFRDGEKTEPTNNGDTSHTKISANGSGLHAQTISNVSDGAESSKNGEVRVSNEPSDSDSDGGKLYSQRGRRSALANATNRMVNRDVTRKSDGDEVLDDDAAVRKDEDEHNEPESRFEGGRELAESTSNMKRSSSTPNILKLNINEGSRPPVDRSTKPSVPDDQLNMLAMEDDYRSCDVGKGLTGLKNLGNTCYMNSILQCLSHTEPLKKNLLCLDPRKINDQSKTRGHIAKSLRAILTQLWNSEGGSVSCKELKVIVGEHRDTFRGYEQQDSHEFLTILIDWLHEDLKQTPQSAKLDGADENSGEKAWGEFTNKNNSIVRQLFYGQLKSTVCCSVCNKESVTFEPFSNLSLPLPTEEKCSLTDCLRLYTKDESILGWQCPGCKTARNATKKLDITKLPPLLVIHLKRFTSDGWCRKRLTNVEFPTTLDMLSFVTGSEHRFSRYRLYAVSNHYGTMESGHYTAYCWNAPSRSWYKFDDQEVTSLGSVPKSSAAYIVFYQYVAN